MKKLFLATALVFGASTIVSPLTSTVAEAKAKTEAFTKADVNLIKKGKLKHAAAECVSTCWIHKSRGESGKLLCTA